jgi:polyisoprenyl-phosphate glycosyltransferase
MTTGGSHTSLAVIVPCYNEDASIDAFMHGLLPVLDQLDNINAVVIVVDDGSTDGSLERLNRMALADRRVLVYALSRNFGHQNALSAGLDVAGADAVIMMDSDLQHPPRLIPEMVARWRDGYDVVSAVRQATNDASLFKRLTASVFYWIINRIGETAIVPGAADFCLLSRRAYLALRAMPERHRFLRGMVSWIGFPRTAIVFDAPPRSAGGSKYTVWKMVALALDALFSFSAAPMRWAIQLGLLFVLLGGLYLGYVLVRFFAYGDTVRGWASLASAVLILGGVQLAFIGLIGEYVARVFEQSKNRPLYLFKQQPDMTARPVQ